MTSTTAIWLICAPFLQFKCKTGLSETRNEVPMFRGNHGFLVQHENPSQDIHYVLYPIYICVVRTMLVNNGIVQLTFVPDSGTQVHR